MKKEMLINVLQPEECRIAILEDGVLEELYVERTSHESYVGNIYKGRIVNIEPSIQAAFVDFGVGRNGFLHVSDVEPAYYRHLEQRQESRGRGRRGDNGRRRPDQRRRQPIDEEEPRLYAAPELADENVEETAIAAVPTIKTDQRPTAPPEAPTMDELYPETAAAEEAEEEAVAPPASEATEENPATERPRGRRRGRGRRTRSDRPGKSAEADRPAAEAAGDERPPEREEEDRLGDDDKPYPMGSAERRTEEGDPESEPLEGGAGASDISDEDLSFSYRPPAPATQEPAREGGRVERAAERAFADHGREGSIETEEEEIALPSSGDREEEFAGALDDEAREVEDLADEDVPEFEEDAEEPERPRRRPRDDRRDDRRGRRPGRRMMSGRPGFGRPKPYIQDIFKRGQEVLVQVIKEGIGTKGPTLSTYISIAGRYLVLMPGLNRIGVSRKIQDDEQRRRLREILGELKPPKGLGFIIRTAGLDRTKKELQNDLAYLSRLWQVVVRRIKKFKSPAEIYQESDMITRTIRDIFTSDIDTIWVDEPTAYEHAKEFMEIVMPRYAERIKLYDRPEPIFHKHGIENEIARIQQRHVPLPNGGSVVIDQTEALVAIDVNSGNFRADNSAEETAYQMNLLAAKEIARQLRLRDLGGVIVNDFIDMRDEKHRRNVERAMREAVRRDRARTKILKISQFGIIEMTRQRIRPSLKRSVYQDCPHCAGTGQVKTVESMSIDVMRLLQLAAHRQHVTRVQVRVHDDVAHYLLNRKRREMARLEESGEIQMYVSGVPGAAPELLEFVCYDNNNNEVKFMPFEEPSRPRRRG
jgi:ribonuclease E